MDIDISKKIESFFGSFPERKAPKHEVLVQAGSAPQGIIQLISGTVRQYDITQNGDEVVVNVFKPPAFFPMSWAINATPNDYFFETMTEVRYHLAPADKAVTFLRDNPDVAFDLLARVYRGTDGLLRRMAHLMGSTAKFRLLYELLIACRRLGTQKGSTYLLPIHENELATLAGLTRETVNRTLSALKNEGLVEVSHTGITVTDLDKLEDHLGNQL